MFVDIYRALGKNGYIYDITLNSAVDYSILESTREIKHMEIIAQRVEFQKAFEIIKSIYKMPTLLARFTSKNKDFANTVIKRNGIEPESKIVKYEYVDISKNDMAKIEGLIIGRVISLEKIINICEKEGFERKDIINIIQALYSERRIKMMPSRINRKDKILCSISKMPICEECFMGFIQDDILLYAADNYNVKLPKNISLNKTNVDSIYKDAEEEISYFMRSKYLVCSLISAPGAFELHVLFDAFKNVVENGGRALFITSNLYLKEAEEKFNYFIQGAKVKIIDNDTFLNFKDMDICISSYENYPCFHKAFDLVVLDYMKAFIKKPPENFINICKRGVKEGGKFIFISSGSYEIKGFKIDEKKIMVPSEKHRSPIIEPMMVVSRALNGERPFIPEIAAEVIKWSLNREIKVFIFAPDEEIMKKVYFYITEIMGCTKDLIEISTEYEKEGIIKFNKGIANVIISTDLKDALLNFDNVNVIVMYSDSKFYTVDRLMNLSAMTAEKSFKQFDTRQVLFVGASESEEMSLARLKIRDINRIGWEKNYIKK